MNSDTDGLLFKSVDDDHQENTLAEYTLVCWRRKWLIVALAVGFAGVAGIWSYIQTPLYQAKAIVVVDQEGPSGLEKEKSYYRPDSSPEYFQTQFELMKSHLVLQRTVQILHLSEQPEYKTNPSAISLLFARVMPPALQEFWWSKKGELEISSEEAEERLVTQFTRNVEIIPIRGSRLAQIIASSEDPKFSARAANTLASTYIERVQELNSRSKEIAAQWYTNHLDELRKKAEAAQRTLYVFRVRHGLLGARAGQAVASQTNTELDMELVRAEMKKADTQSRLEQIQSVLRTRTNNTGAIELDWSSLDASTEVLSSPLIQTLRAQDVRVSGQVAELRDKYGPLHPKLARAQAELQDLRDRIRQEVQKIFDSVTQEYNAALGRVRAIKEAAGRHRQEKIKLEQHDIEYGILEREAESSQHLYDMFLKQTKEADLSVGLRSGNVYLADPAVPSQLPVKPQPKANILLGLMVGLLAGIGLAYVLEYRDRSLKGPRDLKRYLPSITVHGVVPFLKKKDAEDHFSLTSENYRIIRTSLMLSTPDQGLSSLLITSPGLSEGKTTLAVNLSISMAQLEGARVVLIDADLRRPGVHKMLCDNDCGQKNGLTQFLQEEAEFDEILHTTETPNLWVISSGKIPSNPSELLHSKQMAALLTRCRTEGFKVIVDAPPVLYVADATILAPLVDGILFAVSAGETEREACSLAIERLNNAGGKVLGVVMQKVRRDSLTANYCLSDYEPSLRN